MLRRFWVQPSGPPVLFAPSLPDQLAERGLVQPDIVRLDHRVECITDEAGSWSSNFVNKAEDRQRAVGSKIAEGGGVVARKWRKGNRLWAQMQVEFLPRKVTVK
jgi:hypothetical protein